MPLNKWSVRRGGRGLLTSLLPKTAVLPLLRENSVNRVSPKLVLFSDIFALTTTSPSPADLESRQRRFPVLFHPSALNRQANGSYQSSPAQVRSQSPY